MRNRLAAANASEVSDAEKTDFGKDVIAERGDAAAILTGRGNVVSKASQDLIQNLGSMMAGHAVTLAQAAAAVSAANANNQNYLAAFQAFNATAEAMKNHSQATQQLLAQVLDQLKSATQQIRSQARMQ